jgi:hypothetical protein
MKQKLVSGNDRLDWEQEVNHHLAHGWRVVVGTLAIAGATIPPVDIYSKTNVKGVYYPVDKSQRPGMVEWKFVVVLEKEED